MAEAAILGIPQSTGPDFAASEAMLHSGSDSATPEALLSSWSESATPEALLCSGSESAIAEALLYSGSESDTQDVLLSSGSYSAVPDIPFCLGSDSAILDETSRIAESDPEYNKASDEAIFDIQCAPCRVDGHYKEAELYCCDCHDNLCADCVRDHASIPSLKLHKLGDKVRNVNNMNAFYVADIKLGSTSVNNSVFGWISNKFSKFTISGMAMVSDDTLVVAEWGNCVIRLIDTTNKTVVFEYFPNNRPCDVTKCKDTIAATFPEVCKILFLKHARGLVYDREINVNGDCRGIDWCNDKLYVVYDMEMKLEVMTPAGVVLQMISTSARGKQLFKNPTHVTVNAANKRIYVSEWGIGRVVVLEMDGKLKGAYEDSELGRPMQLAIDGAGGAGVMYLCDYRNDTIHLLSPDGEKIKILLTREDGVEYPNTVCYCENTGRLYVGMSHCNIIRVYKISTK